MEIRGFPKPDSIQKERVLQNPIHVENRPHCHSPIPVPSKNEENLAHLAQLFPPLFSTLFFFNLFSDPGFQFLRSVKNCSHGYGRRRWRRVRILEKLLSGEGVGRLRQEIHSQALRHRSRWRTGNRWPSKPQLCPPTMALFFERKERQFRELHVQELRAAAANIGPKHEKEVRELMNSYASLYPKWVFELRSATFLWFSLQKISLFFLSSFPHKTRQFSQHTRCLDSFKFIKVGLAVFNSKIISFWRFFCLKCKVICLKLDE